MNVLLMISYLMQVSLVASASMKSIESVQPIKCEIFQVESISDTGLRNFTKLPIETIMLKGTPQIKNGFFESERTSKLKFNVLGMQTKGFSFNFWSTAIGGPTGVQELGISVSSAKFCEALNIYCMGEIAASSVSKISDVSDTVLFRFLDYMVFCENAEMVKTH